nr:LLM class flavin-dependent oxidoreductase [Bradyrhizobium sp. BRP22]
MTVGIFDHLDDDGRDLAQQYADRLTLTEAYDRLGFHAYHIAEHHCTPHGRGPSPNLFLSSVAPRTRRLRLGPLVMLLNLYHPLRAIEEICMLDHLSGGRLELGIGRGALPVELGYFGVAPDAAQERYVEASEIIFDAMRGGTLSHHGRYFELNDVPLTLLPKQRPHPPMWIAAGRPESAAWAAANGANIACVGPASSVRGVTDAFRLHRAQIRNAGTRSPFIGLVRAVVIAHSHDQAVSLAAPAYERWLASFKFLYDLNGLSTPPFLPLTFEAAVESELCVVGTAASVRDAVLDQVEKAGANYLLCQVAFGNLPLDASLYTATAIQSELMGDLSRKIVAT